MISTVKEILLTVKREQIGNSGKCSKAYNCKIGDNFAEKNESTVKMILIRNNNDSSKVVRSNNNINNASKCKNDINNDNYNQQLQTT